MRALIVSHDLDLANSLREHFLARRVEVNCCLPPQSIAVISRDQPDIVCIDTESSASLPTFFNQLQSMYIAPRIGGYYPIVIGITPCQVELKNSIVYLDLGFDFIFQKPVDHVVFFAQLQALDRRLGIDSNAIMSPHLLLSKSTQDCYIKNANGTLLSHFRVTPLQFELLAILVKSPRGIWSRPELSQRLCTKLLGDFNGRAIDKAIYKIRRALNEHLDDLQPLQPWSLAPTYTNAFIHTHTMSGYYFFDAINFSSDTASVLSQWEMQGMSHYEPRCSTCKHQGRDDLACNACMTNGLSPLVAKSLFIQNAKMN